MPKIKQERSMQEAIRLAKANQRPGQTKEQTKAISLGIQKGIEQYKKQQKGKAREFDKKRKAANLKIENNLNHTTDLAEPEKPRNRLAIILPWGLLIGTWVFFGANYYL